jgi:hypothetical protein
MYRDDEKKYDIRVLEKHFPIDKLRSEEVRVYLDGLPDVSSKIDTEYHFDFTVLPRNSEPEPSVDAPDEDSEHTEAEVEPATSEQDS